MFKFKFKFRSLCTLLVLTASLARSQAVAVRSGNGTVGGTDNSVHFLLGPASGAFNHTFTSTDFAAAQTGAAAFILSQTPYWIPGLSSDSAAHWIGTNSTAGEASGNTALYAVSFQITSALTSATMELYYAADDGIGDGLNSGVYLNGSAVCGSTFAIGFSQQHSLSCGDVSSLLHVGTNWLYIEDGNAEVSAAGLIFSATITTTERIINPQPSIASLTPPTTPAGAGPFTLTITGTGFVSSSAVTFNGVAHPASFIGSGQLSIVLSAADLTAPGSFPVVVTNPSPGGGISQPFLINVQPSITSQVVIQGTAMPWRYSVVPGGLNSGYQYGINDGTGPEVVSTTSGFDLAPGSPIAIKYLSGTVNIGPNLGLPYTDANGELSSLGNTNPGITGKVAPSYYMNPSTYPIYWGELVGTFTDASGDIVGTPFAIGDGPTILIIPPGATQLQLGVNDDQFDNNIGEWTVQVIGSAISATPQTVSASPLTLSFTAPAGSNPRPQTFQVSGTTAGLAFTAQPSSAGNWLSVSQTSGVEPAAINVSVNAAGLAAGTFTGAILVAGTGGAGGQTTVSVTLTVASPLPTISKVTNDASYATGPIAPGEMLAIFGTAIGPATGVSQPPGQNGGQLPTSLGGVEVAFLNVGVAAPIAYASSSQINAVVPYEAAGMANLEVEITYQGQSSNVVTLNLSATAPGIFTLASSGSGAGAILDSSYNVVGPANPANVGDVIQIYCTGLGAVTNQPATGVPAPFAPLAETPTTPVVAIGGVSAQVLYSGLTPGSVGLYQLNAQIPAGIVTGVSVPVVVSIGGLTSNTVTVAIQPFPPAPNP